MIHFRLFENILNSTIVIFQVTMLDFLLSEKIMIKNYVLNASVPFAEVQPVLLFLLFTELFKSGETTQISICSVLCSQVF